MAFKLTDLVVVCMRCPANATLLLVEMEAYEDSVLIWCECHGEHVLASVSGEAIVNARLLAIKGEPVRISMQGLRRIERDRAAELRVESERLFAMVAKRLEALNHFLAAPESREAGEVPL